MAIRVQINGEDRETTADTSVAVLLDELQLAGARVAVEYNRRVLRRDEFSQVMLSEGDQLEIVHFVGGG
jgi:thiamine biosynthesis protein ThiS